MHAAFATVWAALKSAAKVTEADALRTGALPFPTADHKRLCISRRDGNQGNKTVACTDPSASPGGTGTWTFLQFGQRQDCCQSDSTGIDSHACLEDTQRGSDRTVTACQCSGMRYSRSLVSHSSGSMLTTYSLLKFSALPRTVSLMK